MNDKKMFVMSEALQKHLDEIAAMLKQEMADRGTELQIVHLAVCIVPVGKDLRASEEVHPGMLTTFGNDPVAVMSCAELLRDAAYSMGYLRTSISPLLAQLENVLGLRPADPPPAEEGKHVH